MVAAAGLLGARGRRGRKRFGGATGDEQHMRRQADDEGDVPAKGSVCEDVVARTGVDLYGSHDRSM